MDELTAEGERFFVRLIMKADDFGCFYADTRLLKANLFPLKLDKVREADLSRWMAECQKAGLIVLYESAQKKYLQISDFGQRKRSMASKFPPPTVDRNLRTSVSDPPPEVEVEVEGKENSARARDLSNSNLFRKPNIPTKDFVLQTFLSHGGTKEMARSFWNKHEATGWYINGSPIVSVPALVQNFVKNWNSSESKGPKENGPPLKTIQ